LTHEIDTGFLRDWSLIKIEGEEAVEHAPVDVDPKAKKPPAAAAKAPPKGATTALEEITDNRPREINCTKNFQEEGAPAMKVTEDLARYFEKFML